jgi:hypothetical protein
MSKSISRAHKADFNLLPGSCNAGGTTLEWFVHPPIGEEEPEGVGGLDVDGIKTDGEPRESGLIELMSKFEQFAE